MSVFFVNANQDDEVEDPTDSNGGLQIASPGTTEGQKNILAFWPSVADEIKKIQNMDLKTQALPLARIKKIMKLDGDVKMISAEAPMLFSKAAEIFIHELTLRAWLHTEDNKRRTLQRNDIAMAITKYDQFDFLIDIVPRDELKQSKAQTEQIETANTSTSQTVTVQSPQQSTGQQHVIQLQQTQQPQAAPTGNIQIVQQIVGPNGDVQQIPIQLTPQQLQMIRMQVQGGTNQPIIIQAAPIQAPTQLIQVAQGGQAPVYLQTSGNDNE